MINLKKIYHILPIPIDIPTLNCFRKSVYIFIGFLNFKVAYYCLYVIVTLFESKNKTFKIILFN